MFKSLKKKLSKFENELEAELEAELAKELEAELEAELGLESAKRQTAPEEVSQEIVEPIAEPVEVSKSAPVTEPVAEPMAETIVEPVVKSSNVEEGRVEPVVKPATTTTKERREEVAEPLPTSPPSPAPTHVLTPAPAPAPAPEPKPVTRAPHQQKPQRKRATRRISEEHLESAIEAELRHAVTTQKEVEKAVSGVEKRGIAISEKKLDELLWELELGLLESDVALPVIDAIKDNVRLQLENVPIGKKDAGSLVETVLRNAIRTVLASSKLDFDQLVERSEKPLVIMFVGVNGTGKTTSIAKIANRLIKQGKSCVLAAGDTFRAGAIEQLEMHAKKLGVKIIKHSAGSDPAAVAYDAIEHAKARNKDVVLLDTAGRMQTNINLMEEMDKIKRVAKPDTIIFVGDSLAGNDAVQQAKHFNQVVGIDGVILTKVDADAKGGAALSVAYTIGKPLVFIGLGQEYEDQIPFDPDWMVERLFSGDEE